MNAAEFYAVPRFNLDEAAERGQVSARYLRRRISQGTGPAVTEFNGVTWVSVADLREWLTANGKQLVQPVKADR